MAASIADVAKHAKVSISTVSRVINGRAVVQESTRQRVEKAITHLGYRPNMFARGLMLRRSHLLGLVLPDIHGEFYSEVIRGANQAARTAGYHLMVSSGTPQDEASDLLAAVGDHGLVDGVAVMVSELNSRNRQALNDIAIPLVLLDSELDGARHDTVLIDQREGTIALTRHLIESIGIRRLIYVGGGARNLDTLQRLQACRDALRARKLDLPDTDCHFLDYEYQTAYALATEKLADWRGAGNAVFAANDEMAAGIVHAALGLGINVPRDLAVVGFDDTRLARIMQPRLTTVRMPVQALGGAAIELLLRRINDPQRMGETITLHSELVIRESCGASTGCRL